MSNFPFRLQFLRTYETSGGLTGAEVAHLYRRVREYSDANPDAGSNAVASRVGVSRGRLRAWIDEDGKPDALRGEAVADRRSWLTASRETHRDLTELLGAVFGSGWITERTWTVMFRATDHAERLLGPRRLDVTPTRLHRDGMDRLEPTRHASILGRVLVARGAPRGQKVANPDLPDYLRERKQTSRAFARGYALTRGHEDGGDWVMPLHEHRNQEFRDALRDVFDAAVEGPVAVDGDTLVIDHDVRQLHGNEFLTDPECSLSKAHMAPK